MEEIVSVRIVDGDPQPGLQILDHRHFATALSTSLGQFLDRDPQLAAQRNIELRHVSAW